MPDNIQNNPWFQLFLVFALAAAIIYAGINFMPNTNELKTQIEGLDDKIKKLQEVVNEGLALEKRLPELRQTIREKEKQLETLKKIIPTQNEADDLIRKLERMAAETSINVLSFTPKPKEAREFYFEWPIAVTASGTYHNLGEFFSKISNYARIINIQGVRMSALRVEGSPESISTSFSAVTYVYKEEE